MKKVVLFLTAILMIVALSACSANPMESHVVENKISMFVKVEEASFWDVVYHKDTKVMYVVSMGSYNRGNFTVLVNPDGTPMLYEE